MLASGALALALLPANTRAQAAPRAGVTALVGGTLIDGNGGTPITNSVILIQGERITAVGQVSTLAVPAGATVISTEGQYVLPGLWDMHVHLMLVGHGNYAYWDRTYPRELRTTIIPAAARQSLMAGVTSVRDLGAPLEDIMDVRKRIQSGELEGATIYTSGPFLQHAPYPGTEAFRWGINGAADARAKVNRLADAGVDVIKLIDQDEMTMEEMRAVVDEAHKRRLPVVAHAHRPEEVRRGLIAGVDDFEHTGMQTGPGYPENVILPLRERTSQGAKGPLWWTPTIDVLTNFVHRRDDAEYLDDPRWYRYLPDSIARDIRRSIAGPRHARLLSLRARPRPHAADQVPPAARERRADAHRHGRRRARQLPRVRHGRGDGDVGAAVRDGSDGDHPRGDLLAGDGDGSGGAGGDGDAGEDRGHHHGGAESAGVDSRRCGR
ncbi:MAG: amidohydrolase family protein [Rubrivivax sp.]|nr:amidohydrolase family protein [Rubrivivax sp.]